jgi:eukaryotic-like serine/threonine-protein kinase
MSPALKTDRYEILENLGSGATCRVDRALDTVIGRTVAVKSFLQGFGKNSEQQFLQEAQTIGRLSHPCIAQLYDVGHDANGTPFLVMEFVSGKTLEQLLAQGPIAPMKAAVWAADLATALAYAHRSGVIHGDVKPSNIRITDDETVKLVDFGVARFSSQVSRSDRVLGTPAYLSPEQIQGQKQDSRSDLFSLGVVLCEMITGVRPFEGNSLGDVCAQILTSSPAPPTQSNAALPAAFDRILARCLAKNPEGRYQSGNDLGRALYLLARSGNRVPVHAKPFAWLKRPVHPRDFWAVASLVLLFASAAVGMKSMREHFEAREPQAQAVVLRPVANATARLTAHKQTAGAASQTQAAKEGATPRAE